MGKTLDEIKASLPADRREKIEQRYDALVDELREIVAENERLNRLVSDMTQLHSLREARLAEAEQLLREAWETGDPCVLHEDTQRRIDAFLGNTADNGTDD